MQRHFAQVRKPSIIAGVAVLVVIVLHFCYLLHYFAPAISTPDANGYWAQGSLLFTTGRTYFVPESDVQYINIHWFKTESGRYYSQYPPGMAVLAGALYRLFGVSASVMLNLFLASLTLLGLYLISRRLMGRVWAVASVVILAANPIFNQWTLSCFAHIGVMVFLVWGLYFLLRWSEEGKLRQIFVAAVLLGCIPAIRYPEAVFGLAVAVFLLMHLKKFRKIWLHYLVAVGVAAIPMVPLLIHNQIAFGAFYRTAYSLSMEQTAFAWSYFKAHFVPYIRSLHGEGVGLLFPLGVVGMIIMCFVRDKRRLGIMLLILAVPPVVLYMAYYWPNESRAGAGLRFLLPTFICYTLAGFWLLNRITLNAPRLVGASVLFVLMGLQLVWGAHTSRLLQRLHYQKEVLARITEELERVARRGDVIVSNRQILQHLDFVRHWRLADAAILRMDRAPQPPLNLAEKREPRGPIRAQRFAERTEQFRRLPPPERERFFARKVREWAGESRVYFVLGAREYEQMRGSYFNKRYLNVVARIPLPEPPAGEESKRGFRRDMRALRMPPPPGRKPPFGMPPPPPPDRGLPAAGGRWVVPPDEKEIVIAEWTYRFDDAH